MELTIGAIIFGSVLGLYTASGILSRTGLLFRHELPLIIRVIFYRHEINHSTSTEKDLIKKYFKHSELIGVFVIIIALTVIHLMIQEYGGNDRIINNHVSLSNAINSGMVS